MANFLLAWWNAGDCGGFDFTDLGNVDRAIANDILTVTRMIAIRHEYPSAYGYGPQFERLVADWRPGIAGRAWRAKMPPSLPLLARSLRTPMGGAPAARAALGGGLLR